MYVRSQKFGYFGHWLSNVNTPEMKNFDTQTKDFNETKMLNFDFSGLQIYLWPGKIPFATVPNIRLAR